MSYPLRTTFILSFNSLLPLFNAGLRSCNSATECQINLKSVEDQEITRQGADINRKREEPCFQALIPGEKRLTNIPSKQI